MARIYRILTAAQAEAIEGLENWAGAPVDLADGFVHLSAGHQLEETIRRHFAGAGPLLVLAFEAGDLDLTWEPSRGGALFPHLYGELPLGLAVEREWREAPG